MVVRLILNHLTSMSNTSMRNALLIMLFHLSGADGQTHNPFPSGPQVNPYIKNFPHSSKALPNTCNSNPYVSQGSSSYNMSGNGSQYNKNMSETKMSHRLNILASLTSLALASKNTKVLESVAVWMQVSILNLHVNYNLFLFLGVFFIIVYTILSN